MPLCFALKASNFHTGYWTKDRKCLPLSIQRHWK